MPPIWNLVEHHATLQSGGVTASIDCLRPAAGLVPLTIGGRGISNLSVLQVDLPNIAQADAALVDCYVRGGDLVATYAERPAPQMRAQIYWRVQSPPSERIIAAIELVASVQTSLLDDNPVISCSSMLSAQEVFRLAAADGDQFLPVKTDEKSPCSYSKLEGPGCFLFRLAGGVSYAQMVHPADYETSSILQNGSADDSPQVSLRQQLFLRRLEKGVILRSRLLGLFLATEGDQQAVAAAYRNYCLSEPPLTT